MAPQLFKRSTGGDITSSPMQIPAAPSWPTIHADAESESSMTSHISFKSISNALKNIFHIRRSSKKSNRRNAALNSSISRPHPLNLNLNRRGSTSIAVIAPWADEDIESRLRSERRTHTFSNDRFSESTLSLILPPPPPDEDGNVSDDLSYVGILRLIGSNSPIPPPSPQPQPRHPRKLSLRKIASRSELENALHFTFLDAAPQQHAPANLPAERPKFNVPDYAQMSSTTATEPALLSPSIPRRFSLRPSKSARRPSASSTASVNSIESRSWEFTTEQTGLTAPPKSRWQRRSVFPFGFGPNGQDLPDIPGTPTLELEEDGGEEVPPNALVEASKLVRIGQGIIEAHGHDEEYRERKQSVPARPKTLRRTACPRLPREARADSFAGINGVKPTTEESHREYLVPSRGCLKSLYWAGK
ncbi:hypothetical protein RUND412_001283 [Rhizina undulata]